MPLNFDLSGEDRLRVDQFFRELVVSNHKRLSSLEERIESWRELVAEIEAGYPFTIDDYWNDVDTRTIVEQALEVLSPNGRSTLARVLAPLDERFLRATRLIAEPWRTEGEVRNWPWTWYRIPHVLVEDLRNDVERMRL